MFIETEISEFIAIDSIFYFEFDSDYKLLEDGTKYEFPCQVFIRCFNESQHYLGVFSSEKEAKRRIQQMLSKYGKLIPLSEVIEPSIHK